MRLDGFHLQCTGAPPILIIKFVILPLQQLGLKTKSHLSQHPLLAE